MSTLAALEARLSALEADFQAYRRTHTGEHDLLSNQIASLRASFNEAFGEVYEKIGIVARDLGGKADALGEQSKRLEAEAGKIRLQGHFLARVGLLVIFGAAIGGGAVQGGLWWYANKGATHAPTQRTN